MSISEIVPSVASHVVRQALLIVLGDFVVLLEFLDDIEPVTADVMTATRAASVFVGDFHQLLAAVGVEVPERAGARLAFGRGRQSRFESTIAFSTA